MAAGSFFMVGWLGKNVRHHGLLAAKKKKRKKKNWLKFSKTTPKNKIWTRKEMIQNLLFGVVYLLISDFLVDSQSQQKLATKIFLLSIVSVGLVGYVTTSYARDSQFIQTLLWSLEFLIQLNLKQDIFKALGKQMSIYSCKSP